MEFSHIAADPLVCSGKPHVLGTRLTVELLQALSATGCSRKDLMETYPYLTDAEVDQALAYK